MIATDYSLMMQLARMIPPPRRRSGRGPTISSRTPEGRYGRCPLCREFVCIEPSAPLGDAPCPCCGHLIVSIDPLWPIHPELRKPTRTKTKVPARSGRLGDLAVRLAARVLRAARSVRAAASAEAERRSASREPSPSSGVWDPWLDG